MSIIISGSGISCMLLAYILDYLTKGNIKIDLIISNDLVFNDYLNYNTHSIVLTRGSYDKLSFINIWSILSFCVNSINKVIIDNYNYLGSKIIITANDCHLSFLGYILELYDMKIKLLNLINASSNIHLHCPACILHIYHKKNDISVCLDNNTKISSKLLIIADNLCSTLLLQCGIKYTEYNYQQIAVTTNINTSLSNNSSVFEKFTKFGTIALLPVSQYCSALIWCCSANYQNEINLWSTNKFCKELQNIFGWDLGYMLDASKRNFYPLFYRVADRHISHRLALVGNAAQILHPIAGQNFNIGLRDIILLSHILVSANTCDEDIGSMIVLNKYAKSRKLDQFIMMHTIDKIVTLLTTKNNYGSFLRNMGIFLTSNNSFLRTVLIKLICRLVSY